MLNERFWSKVNKSTGGSCWEWTSNKNNKGYGLFKVSAVVGNRLAHRLSYEDAKGKIPKGMLVRHSCDNPLCVNPDHLLRGSYKQNVADMDARGRRVSPRLSGETNPWSKLTDQQVVQMRRDYITGRSKAEIAAANGMTITAVGDVLLGRSWKHLLGVNGAPSLAELKAYGKISRKSNSKITQKVAADIRRRLAAGEMGKDLAVEYGIHKATVSEIRHRKIWAD